VRIKLKVNIKCYFSPKSTSTGAGQGRLAVEDSLGSLEQLVAGADKPDLGQGNLGVAAAGGSPGEVAGGNPEGGTPAVEVGSTAAEGSPVLEGVVDIRRDCNPWAWECRAGRAWAWQVGQGRAGVLELQHKDWGQQQEQLQVVRKKAVQSLPTLLVEVVVLVDRSFGVGGLGRGGLGLQVGDPNSLMPCWRKDPSTAPPFRFSWQSRNL
jgi:hypothetical protein